MNRLLDKHHKKAATAVAHPILVPKTADCTVKRKVELVQQE
jgi:hypothetical protein